MCLAVPMQVLWVRNGQGQAELGGTRHEVDLSLTPDVKPGDFVIVHAGFAIETLDRNEADVRLQLFERLAAENRDVTPPADVETGNERPSPFDHEARTNEEHRP